MFFLFLQKHIFPFNKVSQILKCEMLSEHMQPDKNFSLKKNSSEIGKILIKL